MTPIFGAGMEEFHTLARTASHRHTSPTEALDFEDGGGGGLESHHWTRFCEERRQPAGLSSALLVSFNEMLIVGHTMAIYNRGHGCRSNSPQAGWL